MPISGEGRGNRGWYHGWNVVAVCMLSGIAVVSLPFLSFSLFLRDWSADLSVPFSTLAIGVSASGSVCALLSPVVGVITDRYPVRYILAAGIVGVAIFCVGISYVTRAWEYLALYSVLLPIGMTCSTTVPTNAVVMRWFVRRLGLALGLTSVGLSLGGLVVPPLVVAILPHLGWRLIWRFTGIFIVAVVLPAVLLVIRDRPTERDGLHYLRPDGAKIARHGHGGACGTSLCWADILGRRNFWLLLIGFLAIFATYNGAGYNLAPVALSHGISEKFCGYLLSACSLSQISYSLSCGYLSDRLGNRLPLACTAVLVALGGVTLALGKDFSALLLGAMLIGVGNGFWPLVASALAAEFGVAGFGRAFGGLMLCLPIPVSATFLVAKFKEGMGNYVFVFSALAIVAILGGIACLLIRQQNGGNTAPEELLAEKGKAVSMG
jgi:MFS family permease